jgi:hypothetical protein
MRRFATLCVLLAAFSAPAAATTVETADGDWSKLPELSQRGYNHLSEKMQAKLFEIAASQQCPTFGLKQGRLDMSVSFAAQYAPDGSLDKLILPKLGCPSAESVLGGTLLEMFQGGDYASTGKSQQGWYKGGLTINFGGPDARDPNVAQPDKKVGSGSVSLDPNQIICERVEAIGSRLGAKRTCMSRAQWAEQRARNRETLESAQQQRCNGEGAGQC